VSRTERGALVVALATIAGLLLVALLAVRTDSHQTPAWTVPPSAIRAITTPSGEQSYSTQPPWLDSTALASASPRLPRGIGTEADQSPVATHDVPAVVNRPPTARPAASHSLAELVATGTASFYDAGPGLYAALPGPWRAGRWVRVCGAAQCVSAAVVTSCVCGTHVIDLSPQLWERVSGLDTAHRWQFGVTTVAITIEGGKP
jgi:hypothetical protein